MSTGVAVGFYGVRDLRTFLQGDWRLARVLWDARRGERGVFRGRACFEAAGSALAYCEQGRLRFGDFDGVASRQYRFDFVCSHRARVCFIDSEYFHGLDLRRGYFETRYDCGPDRYLGIFTVPAADCWMSRWTVRGERKDLIIDSRYHR